MLKYQALINKINLRLDELSDYDKNLSYNNLLQAEKYALTAGGKHLRGLIVLMCASLGNIDPDDALDIACAVEMVHTYSLVHDDLPDIDNDDIRRGKPTCHKVFGNDIAIFTGDALLTKAFNIIACNKKFSSDIKIKCIEILSNCCGEHGMLAGQVIDKNCENTNATIDMINELHARKTGDMFYASVAIGCALGGVDKSITNKLTGYISYLGLAFQVKDDILDVTADEAVLGKPINSDKDCQKSTYVTIYGVEKSQQILIELIKKSKDCIKDINCDFFFELADYFENRVK